VTTKSTSRSARSRGSPAPAERSEAKLQEIVSVRFTDEELRRIQAFAVIFETTPNAVIREACSFFLSQKVGSADYHEALAAYHRRTSEVVDVLEQIKSV
jgi:glutamate/tyrosine decarboxylase-like PLP-dependent enzyme